MEGCQERNVKWEEKQKLKGKNERCSRRETQLTQFGSSRSLANLWKLGYSILIPNNPYSWKKKKQLDSMSEMSFCLTWRTRQGLLPSGKAFNQTVSSPGFDLSLTLNCSSHWSWKRLALRKEGWASSSCLAWFMSRFQGSVKAPAWNWW